MRKAWKKAVSVLLTLVLLFGVLPGMNVSAENKEDKAADQLS